MKKLPRALALFLGVLVPAAAHAQLIRHVRPETPYSFGDARAHAHPPEAQKVAGYWCGHGLIDDPTNDTGDIFFGNTACVVLPAGELWVWYDWGRDADAGVKQQVWDTHYPFQWIEVAYDPECKLAVSITAPPAQ